MVKHFKIAIWPLALLVIASGILSWGAGKMGEQRLGALPQKMDWREKTASSTLYVTDSGNSVLIGGSTTSTAEFIFDVVSGNASSSGYMIADEFCIDNASNCTSGSWASGGGSINTLGEIGDVSTTTIATADILMWDGANWINQATSSIIMVSEIDTFAEIDTIVADASLLKSGGTLTSGKLCTYDGTGIDCASDDANTLYVAGDHLQLVGTTFSTQDDFLYNDGDTGTGSYIFSGDARIATINSTTTKIDNLIVNTSASFPVGAIASSSMIWTWATSSEQYFWNNTTSWAAFTENWNTLHNATNTYPGAQTQFNNYLNATTTLDLYQATTTLLTADRIWTISATSTASIDAAEFCIAGASCISAWPTDTKLTQEEVEDYAGGMVDSNTETLITVTYEDGDGTIDFVVNNDLHSYSWANVVDADITDTLTASWDLLTSKPATSTILALLDSDYRIARLNATTTLTDAATTTSLAILGAKSCDTLDTDANGVVKCGTDNATAGAAGSNWTDYDTWMTPTSSDTGIVVSASSTINSNLTITTYATTSLQHYFGGDARVANNSAFFGTLNNGETVRLLYANSSNDIHFLPDASSANIGAVYLGYNAPQPFTFGGSCCGGSAPESFTFTTDGTGDGEIALPAESISTGEIDKSGAFAWTGGHTFSAEALFSSNIRALHINATSSILDTIKTVNATSTNSVDAVYFCLNGADCISAWSDISGAADWDDLTSKPATSTILALLDSDYRIAKLYATSTLVDSGKSINATSTNSMDAVNFCLNGADCISSWTAKFDTFAELNAIVADKTLVNEEDAVSWDNTNTFSVEAIFSNNVRALHINATSSILDTITTVNATSTNSVDATGFCINGANCITAWSYFVQDGCTDCLNATEIEDIYLLDDGDVGTGVYDFGGATTFEIPNGTGANLGAIGQIYFDTTDNQLRLATSTGFANGAVFGKAINRLYAFSVPSTSDDWYFKNMTTLPPEIDGFTVTGVMCQATGTAEARFNLTLSDGAGNNLTTVGCGTVRPTVPTSTPANNVLTAGENFIASYTGKEGTTDNAIISIYGIWTAE